jgi:hypothetical protein
LPEIFCETVAMNTQSAIIKKLETAVSAITEALAAMREGSVREESPIYLTTCKFCKKPIIQGEKVNREIHAACYHLAHDRVARGETTWEELESDGKVGTRRNGGRPRKPTPIDANNPSNYVQPDQPNPSGKKGKRKP